jgi:inorganic pyrophosphatase
VKKSPHFFSHYKDLEQGKWVRVARWVGLDEARRLVMAGIARIAQANHPADNPALARNDDEGC